MKQNVIIAAILMALLCLPVAYAQNTGGCLPPSLCITDEELKDASLDGQSSVSWSWTANPGFFDFSPVNGNNYVNGSLTKVFLVSDQTQSIAKTTVYQWQLVIQDNLTTHNILAQVTYERQGWFSGWDPFPHGNAYYSVIQDGTQVYAYSRIGFDWNDNPVPAFRFSMQLRPSTQNVTQNDIAANITIANNVLGATFPDVRILDAYGGSGGSTSQSLSDWNPLANRGQTDIVITNITQVDALPSLQMSTSNGIEHQHIQYQFKRYGSEVNDIKNGREQAKPCSLNINFVLFQFCLSATVEVVWNFLIGVVTFPINFILSVIPGLDGVKQAILSIIATVFGYFRIVSTIIFGSGPNYPVGGVLIAFVAMMSAFSFPVWVMTGSFSFIWKFPFLFIKYLVIGTATFGKFILIDIPVAIYGMFAGMIP